MKKAVSETVSIVLIIVIIILSAVVVWFWAVPLFGKGTEVPYFPVHISDCNGSHVYIANLGKDNIPKNKKDAVKIFSKDSNEVAAVLNISGLPAGSSEWRPLSRPLSSGEYYIFDINLPESPFSC
ncbi:hypothetical protein DRN74_02885 [Candidatus Micrarchaeota archaeon]|nr:MAG: hypothetical protein DRN74_02885 [Candidatus Micrarchaeota archaeon]